MISLKFCISLAMIVWRNGLLSPVVVAMQWATESLTAGYMLSYMRW